MGIRGRRRAVGVRSAAVGVLAGAVLVALTGCFGYVAATPPKGSERALDRIVERVEQVPGVAHAEGRVQQRDVKDHPDEWLAVLTVRAGTDDVAVAGRVRSIARSGVPGTTLSASYGFPHRGSTPAVSVDPMHGDLVAFAARLRTLPFVESAIVATGHIGVHLQGDATTSEAVERLRPVPTEVPTTVDRDDESVEVTALQPGAAMLATIDSLRDDPRTSQVYFIAGTTYEQADPARAPSGARVAVVTSDVRGVVERLAGTADEAADAHVVPRASYSVEQPDDLADHTEGPVGLPVGSAQPDDTGNLAPSARPGSTTPPWTPADVDAQAAVLRSFLDRSVTATGVHATVTTGTDQCAPSGATLLTGTRATAQVLVPVFTRYDDAQEPFDAVTDAWTADGLRMTDAAMGLDHWAAPDDAAPLASATIRGSTEGLRLTAESVCVG